MGQRVSRGWWVGRRTDGLVSLAWPACSAASWMGFLSAMVQEDVERARRDDALEVVERKTVRSMFNVCAGRRSESRSREGRVRVVYVRDSWSS